MRLSAPYEDEAREAEGRTRPVEVLDAGQLHAVVDSVRVTELIVHLLDRL